MKITFLKVAGYKSFEKLELKLLDLNMIYGYNNSGKSNILKFLALVFESRIYFEEVPVDGRIVKREVKQNFWQGTIINVPYIFRIDKNGKKAKTIDFEIDIEFPAQEYKSMIGEELYSVVQSEITKGQNDLIIKIKGQIVPSGLYDAQLNIIEVFFNKTRAFYINKSGNEEYFEGKDKNKISATHYINTLALLTDSVLFLDADRYFVNELDSINGDPLTPKNVKSFLFNLSLSQEKREAFLRSINNLKDFKFTSSDTVFSKSEKNNPLGQVEFTFEFIRGSDKSLELMLTNGMRRLPITSFGSGIQQIIYQLIAMHIYNRKIVLIEEFELNLSPKYQRFFIEHLSKLIKDYEVGQIFFTTHNPILSYRAEFKSIQVRIDEVGNSTAESITLDNIKDGDQLKELKRAQKLLENFHPSKIIEVNGDALEKDKKVAAAVKGVNKKK